MIPEESASQVPWSIRSNARSTSVLKLVECMAEAAVSLEEFAQITTQPTPSIAMLVAKTRQISVALRKMLLDGNGSLVKQCIANPEMHAMKEPASDAKTLTATRSFKEQTHELSFTDGSSRTYFIPAFDYRAIVHPLYGISHEPAGNSILTSPFDLKGKTIKFSKWTRTKILAFDNMQFDVRAILNLMAVNEGAHANESHPMIGPILPDEDNNSRYSAVDGVKFGVFSYMHFFTLFTGLYLVHRFREALNSGTLPDTDPRIREMCELISSCPQNFPSSISTQVSIAANPVFVLGENHELISDFSGGSSTIVRIPMDKALP